MDRAWSIHWATKNWKADLEAEAALTSERQTVCWLTANSTVAPKSAAAMWEKHRLIPNANVLSEVNRLPEGPVESSNEDFNTIF